MILPVVANELETREMSFDNFYKKIETQVARVQLQDLIVYQVKTHIQDRRGRWSSDIRAETEKKFPEGKEDVKKCDSLDIWDEDVEKICKVAFHSKNKDITANDVKFAKQVVGLWLCSH